LKEWYQMNKLIKLLLIAAGIAFYAQLILGYVHDAVRGYQTGVTHGSGSDLSALSDRLARVAAVFSSLDQIVFLLWGLSTVAIFTYWVLAKVGKVEGKGLERV
jgi:hypothetical protein